MPNCFQLTRKSDPKAGPVPLNTIDKEMCEHFKVPVDKKYYCRNWFDTIGFGLATGHSFAAQITECEEGLVKPDASPEDIRYYSQKLETLRWMEPRFDYDAWVEIGRNHKR